MSEKVFIIPESAPAVGAIHAHYKNLSKEYRVTGLSLNSDSNEWHVEYIPLYEDAVANKFNRSLSSWLDQPQVNGESVERYPFVRMA
jgi:hypothetical protein